MTQITAVFGARTITRVTDVFTKTYYNLTPDHWDRIFEAYTILANNNMGPKILTVAAFPEHNHYVIHMEKIIPFYPDQVLTPEQTSQIDATIAKLHSLDYAHGDLHLGNLGYRPNPDGQIDVMILDPDTMFKISQGFTGQEWVKDLMLDFFDDISDFDTFVSHDLNNYKG